MKETAKAAAGASIPPIAGTILETALIVAIVAEAGYVAILNREKILDVFRTGSVQPTVEQVSPPPDFASPPDELPVTGPTVVIETAEPTIVTATATAMSTATPEPPFVRNTEVSGNSTAGAEVNSTPRPHDDNGNHYGQTPKAERTHESRDDGDDGGSDPKKDDEKPKDNEGDNKGNTPDPNK
jgi:hypothetical protein